MIVPSFLGNPHLYAIALLCIVCGEMDRVLEEGITIEDIPCNAATATLLHFLKVGILNVWLMFITGPTGEMTTEDIPCNDATSEEGGYLECVVRLMCISGPW